MAMKRKFIIYAPGNRNMVTSRLHFDSTIMFGNRKNINIIVSKKKIYLFSLCNKVRVLVMHELYSDKSTHGGR